MWEAGRPLGWVVHGADGGCDAGEDGDCDSEAERQDQDMPPQQPQPFSQQCPRCPPAIIATFSTTGGPDTVLCPAVT